MRSRSTAIVAGACTTSIRLLYNQCVFEATGLYGRPQNAPPMVWARAGWTGSQRYPIQWGGDPQSDWEGLAASIRGGLSWGMSGAPFHATDIGGFYGATQPSAELFVRWLQAAVFSSHIRVHGIGEREPWAFGARRGSDRAQMAAVPLSAAALSAARHRRSDGDRAARHARDAARVSRRNARRARFDTQFMCGDALLVAPIIAAGGEVDDRLPRRRVVRHQHARTHCRGPRDPLQGDARQVSRVRPRRLRAAARPRGPAYGRDRRRAAARAALGVRNARRNRSTDSRRSKSPLEAPEVHASRKFASSASVTPRIRAIDEAGE